VAILRSNIEALASNGARATLRLAPRRRWGIHIDMTPMVDVAFLLVIFFMVTALFRKPQILALELPPPTEAATLAHTSVMSVKVREDGRLYWQLGADSLRALADEGALRSLAAERSAADPSLVVLVKVDAAAPYRRMVDVLDELAQAKIARVTSLPLEPAERDEVNALP
jgi:biopolymer transport protein ExbD